MAAATDELLMTMHVFSELAPHALKIIFDVSDRITDL